MSWEAAAAAVAPAAKGVVVKPRPKTPPPPPPPPPFPPLVPNVEPFIEVAKMDIDEDDDFYAPEEPTVPAPAPATENAAATKAPSPKVESKNDELEEGEEEDEGGAMDEDDDEDSVSFCLHLRSLCVFVGRPCISQRLTVLALSSGYRHHHRAQRRHKGCTPNVRLNNHSPAQS